jgi:hypothetical protein
VRRVGKPRRLRRPLIAAISVVALAATTATLVTTAFAENPIYCEKTTGINGGCEGPHGLLHVNEARNESGGCIAIQAYLKGYGYSEPYEVCGGSSAHEEETVHVEGFPKCWNRSNASDLIRCRYAFWST